MIDIEHFKSIAKIERTNTEAAFLKELPPPHPLAAEIVRRLTGVRMVPFGIETNDQFDVAFGTQAARGDEATIRKLSSILGQQLYPIAGTDYDNGIVLLSETGDVYGMSVSSYDIYWMGNLEHALSTMLLGEPMKPVLPRRDYPQDHNAEVYAPESSAVMWIDTPEWIAVTKCNNVKQGQAT